MKMLRNALFDLLLADEESEVDSSEENRVDPFEEIQVNTLEEFKLDPLEEFNLDPPDRRNCNEIIKFENVKRHPSNFLQDFGIDLQVVNLIVRVIGPFLSHPTRRSNALSAEQQILVVLRFLGHGAQYHVNGNAFGVTKATVCRSIHSVVHLINRYMFPRIVKFPSNMRAVADRFEAIAGFPHVAGLIDGTLICLDIDEKEHHSLNLTVVAGPQHEFFFASCKCPGSVRDSRALKVSKLWKRWNDENWRPPHYKKGVILGDRAYPSTQWLLTPTVCAVNNTPENAIGVRRYIQKHQATRFRVENAIAILKEEFPTLNYLRVRSSQRQSAIVMACVALHNLQNKYRNGDYDYNGRLQKIADRQPNLSEELPDEEDVVVQQATIGAQSQRDFIRLFNQPIAL